jgi:hypothetical protein
VSVESLDGDVELLMPGMKGEARIVTGRLEEAVIIPRSALRGEADAPYVFVRTASGAERRAVKLGPGDLVRVSIEDGLSGGERVVIGDEQPLAEDEQNTARSRRGTARSGGA